MLLKQEQKLKFLQRSKNLGKWTLIFRRAISRYLLRKEILTQFLVIVLLFAWVFSGWPQVWQNPSFPPQIKEAQAAVTYFASASKPVDNGTNITNPTVVTPPANMQEGDLVIMAVASAATSGTIAMSSTGGQTWTALTQRNTSRNRARIFYATFNGTWGASPSVTVSTSNGIAVMHVFRPSATTYTWELDAAESSGTYGAPASPYTVTINEISTQTNGALVFATWTCADDNTWTSLTNGWSTPGTDQYRNTSGSYDQTVTSAYKIQTTAGATGNVSKTQATNPADAGNYYIIAFKEVPPVTTLGNGSDPNANSIAPGSVVTDVNTFTLQASKGTETISDVTVNLSTNSGIERLAITDNSNNELGYTTSPVAGSNVVSVSGMSAGSTSTTFKVRVIPLSHALMPSPAGGSYNITAPVTDWTGTGSHTHQGSDSNSNALTIDNASPSNATSTSGTEGDSQNVLNWTTSNSGDFNRSVILRWAADTPGSEVPTEGSDYVVNDTINSATVVCVRTGDSASVSVSGTDGAGIGGCSSNALTNGQNYSYRVFQKDSNGNYDTGTTFTNSPFMPVGVPSALNFTNITATSLQINWTAPSGISPSSYSLDRCEGTGCGSFAEIASGVSGTYYPNGGLNGNTIYRYRVRAIYSDGVGTSSPVEQLLYSDIPTSLNFTDLTATSLRLNWTAPFGGADSYKVERCLGSGCTNFSQITSGETNLYYDDSPLVCDTLYRYKIRATNALGDGTYSSIADVTTGSCGSLAVDIVNSSYVSVSNPIMAMNNATFSFSCQTITGIFGTASQQIYVSNNNNANNGWTLTMAAQASSNIWNSIGTDYDFNDATGSGCSDGGDADSLGGQMTVNPAVATLVIGQCPSCTTANISKGSSSAFNEGSTNTITLLTATAASDDVGDWTLRGVSISQKIPAEQPVASDYDINMVLTITAN